MAAANTYTPIFTTTLGSAQASVTFSSIPSTYTDLVLVISANEITGNNIFLQFNGDTGSNYSRTFLSGTGSSSLSGRDTTQTNMQIDAYGYAPTAANTFGVLNAFIQNYSNTTTYKTVLSRANNASAGVDACVGLWKSTAAINSILIDIIGTTANFNTGSTFSLYGILAA
jgi:hypothetical protein